MAKFCAKCGAKRENGLTTCLACSEKQTPHRYCIHCGRRDANYCSTLRGCERRAKHEALHKRRQYQRAHYHANKAKILIERRVSTSSNPEAVRARNYKHQGLPAPTRPRPDRCELCGAMSERGRVLALDHCHESNTFRGWLCAKCNTGLGKLGDNEEGLLRAIEYLKRNTRLSWLNE